MGINDDLSDLDRVAFIWSSMMAVELRRVEAMVVLGFLFEYKQHMAELRDPRIDAIVQAIKIVDDAMVKDWNAANGISTGFPKRPE
jgi:hypothetical protein